MSSLELLVFVVVAYLAYHVLRAAYNLSPLHPLSHVPGPRLAAATYLPELYWDVVKYGRYTGRIAEMHRKYGPLVRINPDELHCADVNFSDDIYAVSGRRREKPQMQANGSALDLAEFGTVDHDLHRLRRAPVARFFSRAMIARLEPDVQAQVQTLCDKLLATPPASPVDVAVAYSCFTTDTISSYAFGRPFGLLAQDGWYPNFRDPTQAVLRPVFVWRFLPWLKKLNPLAVRVLDWGVLPNDVALMVRSLQVDVPAQVAQTKADLDAGRLSDRPTIFGTLLQSELTREEKSAERLALEGVAVLSAGTETTAWTLAVLTYWVLRKPEVRERLEEELRAAGAGREERVLPSWVELEKLPYLGAVIQEALRLSYGVSLRTSRVAPDEDLVYRGEWAKKPVEYVVPRGYAVGMSTVITHHDESVFPDSHAFIPDRWLDEQGGRRKEVEKGQMSFGKGSRMCLGMNLALCELNLTVAALTLRVFPHMRLHHTDEHDVRYDHDMFIPQPRQGSQGVRVTIGASS